MQQKLLNAVLACFWENDGQELAPINSSLAKPAFYVNKALREENRHCLPYKNLLFDKFQKNI